MAGTTYRPTSTDPLAALQAALSGGGAPTTPFVPTAPHSTGTSADASILERPDIVALMSAMFPVEQREAHSGAHTAMATIGDALSAYASGMGAGARTDFLGALRSRREQSKGVGRERAGAELGIKVAEDTTRRRTQERSQEGELERAGRLDEARLRGANDVTRQSSINARQEDAQTDRAARDAARPAAPPKSTPTDPAADRTIATERRKAIRTVKEAIAGTADALPDLLAGGKTPETIHAAVRRQIAIHGLDGDAEAVADIERFYSEQLAPLLQGAASMPAAGNGPAMSQDTPSWAQPPRKGGAGTGF